MPRMVSWRARLSGGCIQLRCESIDTGPRDTLSIAKRFECTQSKCNRTTISQHVLHGQTSGECSVKFEFFWRCASEWIDRCFCAFFFSFSFEVIIFVWDHGLSNVFRTKSSVVPTMHWFTPARKKHVYRPVWMRFVNCLCRSQHYLHYIFFFNFPFFSSANTETIRLPLHRIRLQ